MLYGWTPPLDNPTITEHYVMTAGQLAQVERIIAALGHPRADALETVQYFLDLALWSRDGSREDVDFIDEVWGALHREV